MVDPNLQQKLDAIFKAHMDAELSGNLDKTLATMAPNPHLVNVPTMVGGHGPESVRTFYAKRLIGQFFPPDVKFETISRTYSQERLVDELIISFTHTTGPRSPEPVRQRSSEIRPCPIHFSAKGRGHGSRSKKQAPG